MQRLTSTRMILGAAIALGTLAAASAAQARTDVFLSLGVPGIAVAPQPVYVQPAPVYVQPEPVYVQPERVYVQPQPVYVQPQPVYIEGHRHGWRHHGGWRDDDHDGVPNRYDRAPFNPYRR